MTTNGFHAKRSGWSIKSSREARETINPIRRIVDRMNVPPNPDKELIRLSIGDPTVFGNLPPSQAVASAAADAVASGKHNGYCTSFGTSSARTSVAEAFSTPGAQYTADDVILTSGCSGAIDMAITVLANPGQNILIPRPGFSLYRCLGLAKGVEVRTYQLLPKKEWEADLDEMESQIDENTVAIIVNSPSNPCGSVYSRKHLEDIAAVAERNFLPIIADEVYAGMVFSGSEFHAMAAVTDTVPVLTCGGLAKRYLVPGWRLGWILIKDTKGVLSNVRDGLRSVSQQILGPCSLIQGALPAIMQETPQEFFENTIRQCEEAASFCFQQFSKNKTLSPVMPSGAMYMMVGINLSMFKDINDDVRFTELLVAEESVHCLPGQCFEFPNFFRVVLSVPLDQLAIACSRIQEFCDRHASEQA